MRYRHKGRPRDFESSRRLRKAIDMVCDRENVSCADVAETIGHSPSMVYSMRSGTNRVSLDFACALQERFGVSAAYVLALDTVKVDGHDE